MSSSAPPDRDPAQAEVIDFLGSAKAHGGTVATVERIETHGALVFLTGDHAYKIKKAVCFSYMDFSTLDLRRRASQREIEVNQPHAPDLYLGLVAITRTAGGALVLGGDGEPVEWAVHMRRFPADALLSRIVERGEFGPMLASRTADAVFDYHRGAAINSTSSPAERLTVIVSEVAGALRSTSMSVEHPEVAAFETGCRRHLASIAPLLEQRASSSFVRRCHGDLHLANIVLWRGRPTLFDAIEFDETIATIDTLYDLAFLLMDLDERDKRASANMVLNRYLWRSQHVLDLEGLAALPLFLGLRAGIRAMVLAQRAAQERDRLDTDNAGLSRAYLAAALRYLSPDKPRLVAVGGLSGTGKSTLAAALAPRIGTAPGAVHLRSDLERKALFGVAETDRLPPQCYSEQAGRTVYERLLAKARAALTAGQSVVVDAVFLREEERQAIQSIAQALSIPFHGLWLTAPAETLLQRVEGRTGDASDATVDVVRLQLAQGHGGVGWALLDASGSPEDIQGAAWTSIDGGQRGAVPCRAS